MDIVKKTRKRFMIFMMIMMTLMVVIALVSIYWLTYHTQESNNRERLQSFEKVNITKEGTVSFDEEKNDAVVVERVTADIGPNFSLLTNEKGEVLSIFSTVEISKDEVYQEAADIAWLGKNYNKIELDGRTWQYAISPTVSTLTEEDTQIQESEKVYQIRFIDISESQDILHSLQLTLVFIGLTLLIFLFFFCLYFSKKAVAPLHKVLLKQQQFISDASHELKTPISIIKANTSVLYANKEQSISSQKEWLDNIMIGSDRMLKLIQSLLMLSKMEEFNESVNTRISVKQVIEKILVPFAIKIKEKELDVIVEGEDIIIWSDLDCVFQVLTIVIENAIKYVNEQGTIWISIKQEKKWNTISIINTGEGIKKEDLNKIFDRFYRGEDARTHTGSYGLGLSIAKTTMKQLQGKIIVKNDVSNRTEFVLYFPKKGNREV